MRRFTISLILSLLISASSGIAFADKHHKGHGDDRDRYERKEYYRHDRDKHDKDWRKDHDRYRGDRDHGKYGPISMPRPGYGGDNRGYSKARKDYYKAQKKYIKERERQARRYYRDRDRYYRYRYGDYRDYDPELLRMIAYAARGGRDIRVWHISDDTFLIKYWLGGRYYTQRLYPGSGRYGARGMVNINWNPLSSWTLLPSININIPID